LGLVISISRKQAPEIKHHILPLIIEGGEVISESLPFLFPDNFRFYQNDPEDVAMALLALGQVVFDGSDESFSKEHNNIGHYLQLDSKILQEARKKQVAYDIVSLIPLLQRHRLEHEARLKRSRQIFPSFADKRVPAWVQVNTTSSMEGYRLIIGLRNVTCSYRKMEPLHLGCFNCGFYAGTGEERPAKFDELQDQLHYALRHGFKAGQRYDVVEFLGDGSFFNDEELSEQVKVSMFHALASMAYLKRILVESTPEHIIDQRSEIAARLNDLRHDQRLEIGIGLETSDDFIRRVCINKGFSWEVFCKAVEVVKEINIEFSGRCSIVTYILVKPPLLEMLEVIQNTIETLKDLTALAKSSGVLIIPKLEPAAISDGTLLSLLYQSPPLPRQRYTPLNYWTILEIITRAYITPECSEIFGQIRIGAREDMDDVIKVPAVYCKDGLFDQFDFILYDAIQQFNRHHNIFKLYAVIKSTFCGGLSGLWGSSSSYTHWVNTELANEGSEIRAFMERNESAIDVELDDLSVRLETEFLAGTYKALDLLENRDSEKCYFNEITNIVQAAKNPIDNETKIRLQKTIYDSFPESMKLLIDIIVIDVFIEPEGLLRIFFEVSCFVTTRKLPVWTEVPLKKVY